MPGVEAKAALRRRGDHVENENGAHAVIAEALPKFGEEKWSESEWMTEQRVSACFGDWRCLNLSSHVWLFLRGNIVEAGATFN